MEKNKTTLHVCRLRLTSRPRHLSFIFWVLSKLMKLFRKVTMHMASLVVLFCYQIKSNVSKSKTVAKILSMIFPIQSKHCRRKFRFINTLNQTAQFLYALLYPEYHTGICD